MDGDDPDVELPAVDLAWRVGVSDVADVSVRGFYGGGGIGLYADVKAEVMSGPVWVSPVFGASVAADLEGGASVAAAPGLMFGNEQIWGAPRALIGTTAGEGVSTGFGFGVGGSYGGAVRVMPEANLFYLPADFERDDLYLGFTIGLAYRRSNAPVNTPVPETAPDGESTIEREQPVEPDEAQEGTEVEAEDIESPDVTESEPAENPYPEDDPYP